MRAPTMMLSAGNDAANVKVDGLMHAALRQNGLAEESLVFHEYPTMKHGWVNRGDLKKAEIAEA